MKHDVPLVFSNSSTVSYKFYKLTMFFQAFFIFYNFLFFIITFSFLYFLYKISLFLTKNIPIFSSHSPITLQWLLSPFRNALALFRLIFTTINTQKQFFELRNIQIKVHFLCNNLAKHKHE